MTISAMRQAPAAAAAHKRDEPFRTAGGRSPEGVPSRPFGSVAFFRQQPLRQQGRQEQGKSQRDGQGGDHHQRQRAEKLAGQVAQKRQRQEGGHGRHRRADHGRGDRLQSGGDGRPTRQALFQLMEHVLDDHDAVVNDQAQGDGKRAEGHDVQRLPQRLHQSERDDDRQRQDDQHDGGHAQVAQKEHQDEQRQDAADDDGLQNAGLRLLDDLRLVIKIGDGDARRQVRADGSQSPA